MVVTLSASTRVGDVPLDQRYVMLTIPRARPRSRRAAETSDKPGGHESATQVSAGLLPVKAWGRVLPASAVTRSPLVRVSNVPLLLPYEHLLLRT